MASWRRILIPALVTWCAGALLGFWLGRRTALPASGLALDSDLQAYYRTMVESFELEPERARKLKILLSKYQMERNEILRDQRLAAENRLAMKDSQFENLIFGHILSREQRHQAEAWRRTAGPGEPLSTPELPGTGPPR
ncbi:MAG: hypothetical protein DWQ01_20960 [Planctomycetota bacterium]|nr:MAG: hypothetical protein DWQ01_20960 [Planctomycetota bacterium]